MLEVRVRTEGGQWVVHESRWTCVDLTVDGEQVGCVNLSHTFESSVAIVEINRQEAAYLSPDGQVQIGADMQWSKEWPTDSGEYWFYGYLSAFARRMDSGRDLCLVKVRQARNATVYVTEGCFLFKGDAFGMWAKADVPPPPDWNMT